MHFFWDNLGRIKQRRFSATQVNRKWAIFHFKLPWRYQICITKRKYPYRDDLRKKLFKIKAQECKSLRPVDVRHSKTSQLQLPHNGMDGPTDAWMGRLIPNFFRVFQILLEITVVVSLRNYWRSPREVDYSLIWVSTMHHPEHCQFCINCSFLFWYRATLYMLICILKDPVIQRWSTFSYIFPPC